MGRRSLGERIYLAFCLVVTAIALGTVVISRFAAVLVALSALFLWILYVACRVGGVFKGPEWPSGLCRRCGYDLATSPDEICPECGEFN